MLRKTRVALATIFFVGITLLFIGIGQDWWGWMAKIQFLPAVMKLAGSALALNVAVVGGLLLLTLIFGRVYCSVICPLGVMQDVIGWIQRKLFKARTGKTRKYSYSKELKIVRYGVWAIFVACLIAGLQVLVALVAPYSAYGRIVRSLVSPSGWQVPVIAAVTFMIVAVLAWTGGRTWCNTICPVGTTLSFFSRFAMFRPMIDTGKCVKCRACERACKASCIDVDGGKIDYSRCVDCFDCIGSCKLSGLKYRFAWKKGAKAAPAAAEKGVDAGKRAFIAGAMIAGATTLKAQEMKLDGGLADILPKQKPERKNRLVPFGAKSEKDFYSKCTACQLCVSACPNNVLRPSTDLMHLMQPEMSYENGWCRPECTECSQVCPAGAITAITPEEKTAEHIGRAVVDLELCLANTEDVACGNCSRHCPAGAIKMVKNEKGKAVPAVMEELCMGCGACEFLCPVRPISAIHVDGLKSHIKE